MSTKAIRRLIGRWRKNEHPLDSEVDAAEMEVETIVRTAKDAYRGDVTHRLSTTDSGLELAMLLEDIARETT